MGLFGSTTQSILANRKSTPDFMREKEEFEARKRARQMQEEMGQVELEQARKQLEMGVAGNDPAAVREYNFFSKLSPQEQQKYLSMKRSDQVLNLGGQMAVRSPMGGIQEAYDVTPKITETPQYKAQQAGAQEQARLGAQMAYQPSLEAAKAEQRQVGTERGVATAKLESMEANMPKLQNVVSDLKRLNEQATYTRSGQLIDAARREAGFEPTEGAVARAKAVAKIDNEVLPLLRETFGAAFTVEEGNRLKATFGDPNLSPQEKNAALDALIEAKTGEIGSLRARVGLEGAQFAPPSPPQDVETLINQYAD